MQIFVTTVQKRTLSQFLGQERLENYRKCHQNRILKKVGTRIMNDYKQWLYCLGARGYLRKAIAAEWFDLRPLNQRVMGSNPVSHLCLFQGTYPAFIKMTIDKGSKCSFQGIVYKFRRFCLWSVTYSQQQRYRSECQKHVQTTLMLRQ